MKLNISYPEFGMQKTVEIDDDLKLAPFFDKRMAAEIPGDSLGDEFKGYVFRITGGNDKQGFPMMQGVLTSRRVRLLFKEGMKCFRPRRKGQYKRKGIRGCIVSSDIGVLALSVVKKGDNDIPGLTDGERARRLGPKRANSIRKLFCLSKTEDPRPYVIRRPLEGKKKTKAPKIQRLVTGDRLQLKKVRKEKKAQHIENSRKMADAHKTLMEKHMLQKKTGNAAKHATDLKKKGVKTATTNVAPDAKTAPVKKTAATKVVAAPKTKPAADIKAAPKTKVATTKASKK